MNRFENMETFIKVVESGSISGAAERLDVAKSAVSRRLKELEEYLGVQLFHRTTRRLNLTDTGRTFYHQSVRILEDLLEAELATSQAHAELQGSLRVALPLSFGTTHLGPAIIDFLQQHPNIEFDLDFNDREVDIIQEGFDLAIRIARLPDSSLIARKLAPIQQVICASPGYLEQYGTPGSPYELREHQCLVYNLLHEPETWTFTDNSKQAIKVKIKPRIRASVGEYLRDAAVNGQGIVYIPAFIVYREIEQGALVPLLRNYSARRFDAYAIYPQTRHLSHRVRAFVDFLVDRFNGVPYWDLCLK